jgi:beta-glucoside PTS system EIICBA component
MDYAKIAQQIIVYCGNKENIASITHCTTRLRIFIKEKSIVEQESIKTMEGVIGVVYVNDELQIVLGKNLLPIYNEAAKLYDEQSSHIGVKVSSDRTSSVKEAFGKMIGFVSAAVTPMIPGLVAGGMLKVFLLLATLGWKPFASSQTYILLSMLADIPFYFMPVFIAFGAAKKLGATPIYAMVATAGLVYPEFIKLLGAGGDPVAVFGIPVMAVKYSSTLLPALLISLCAYYCENLLVKVIPGIIRPVLVGMGTIIISYTLGITILGPLGDLAGGYLVNVFLWPSAHFGGIAVGFLAACMPWLVMTGMHHAVTPFMVQAITNPGYDVLFRPAYLLHNMAEGGACIGVGLKTKRKKFKAECFSLAFGCIIAGVSEPAIYGINLRLKRPMYGVMAGGAAGGIVAGSLGATAYVYGYSTLLAIPIFQQTILAILAGIIVTIIVSAVVTMSLGFDETNISENIPEDSDVQPVKKGREDVMAPASGAVIKLEDVQDAMFSQGMLGQGCGIQSEDGKIYAPVNGTITMVAATSHAIGITSDDGMEILIHVGIDTVKLNGQGFVPLVKEGEKVSQGQLLMTTDIGAIKAAGYDDVIILVLTNRENYSRVTLCQTGGKIEKNNKLLEIVK